MTGVAGRVPREGDGRGRGGWWRRPRWAAAALVVLTVAAYLPALRAGFIWDDDWHVTENRTLRSLAGLRDIWLSPSRPGGPITTPQYYPLTHTTFWVEHHLWANHPLGYHLDNVLLHAVSAVLLWALLRRLSVPGAWVAAAVWAVHPVNVESVAWVTERKNVLSGVCYFAAALAYLRFAGVREGPPPPPQGRRSSWGWYGASLGLFLGALLSKTVASTLPAALLLVLWWKRGGRVGWRRDVLPLVPFLVVGAALGLHTSWMERHVVGAMGPEWNFSPADRLLIASRAACFYAAKVFFPVGLSFNYVRWSIDPSRGWQWLFLAAVVVATAALALLAARRRVRGPLVGWLFFLGTLAPALGFFDVYPMRYSFVADHFQYMACAGLITAVTAGSRRLVAGRRFERAWCVAAAIVLVTFAGLTSVRAGVFRGPLTLWRDALAKNPDSWLARMNLEKYYVAAGDRAAALKEIEAAAAIRPDDPNVRTRLAQDLAAVGRIDDARREHEAAIRIAPGNAEVHYNYGQDLARWGEDRAAETEYRKAMALNPRLPLVRNNLGLLLASRGDLAGAISLYREELAVNSDAPAARLNLANALLQRHDLDGAERTLRDLLAADPGDAKARNTLALVLIRRNDLAGAERELRRAIADDPGLPESHNTLGGLLAMEGRLDEAVAEYREALRLKPDFPQARRNLEAAQAAKAHAAGRPK